MVPRSRGEGTLMVPRSRGGGRATSRRVADPVVGTAVALPSRAPGPLPAGRKAETHVKPPRP